ncbi:hypothetical protein RHSIM_Rhsim01G0268300 [Rhododendron simsii]|uniref:Uncharacterized protein n=1 Tax=Rhododendron simsii TaxID=118357 RepID=A0A834HJV9_RHOSS|nr:hypothetical protein RHSIM_Rhsim01G0268300 [Rhododendron simsii]
MLVWGGDTGDTKTEISSNGSSRGDLSRFEHGVLHCGFVEQKRERTMRGLAVCVDNGVKDRKWSTERGWAVTPELKFEKRNVAVEGRRKEKSGRGKTGGSTWGKPEAEIKGEMIGHYVAGFSISYKPRKCSSLAILTLLSTITAFITVSTACSLILEEGTDAGQGFHGLEALKASLMENCSFQAQLGIACGLISMGMGAGQGDSQTHNVFVILWGWIMYVQYYVVKLRVTFFKYRKFSGSEYGRLRVFVWPFNIVLAEYVWQRRLPFSRVSIVELGAGTSLPGLVAVKVGSDVTLTDDANRLEVLANMRSASDLNNLNCNVMGLTWGVWNADIFPCALSYRIQY